MNYWTAIAIVCLGLPSALEAQSRIRVIPPPAGPSPKYYPGIGRSIAALGDLNRDGHGDFVCRVEVANRPPEGGGYYVYSGKDGSVIRRHLKANGEASSGDCTRMGDLDADGWEDYALGAPFETYGTGGNAKRDAGWVDLISGKAGKLLLRKRSTKARAFLGAYLRLAGDIDSDGVNDFVSFEDGYPGATNIYSGRTGKVLRQLTAYRTDFASLGDIDADGVPDYVHQLADHTMGKGSGAVVMISGKTGKRLRVWYGQGPQEGFGWRVAPAGDVNRDGKPDIVVSAYSQIGSSVLAAGYVKVLSATGPTIWKWSGPKTFVTFFGSQCGSAGDVNGDRYPDIYVSTALTKQLNSAVIVYSGKTGAELYRTTPLPGSTIGPGGHPTIGVVAAANIGDTNGDGRDDLAVVQGPEPKIYGSTISLQVLGGGFQSLRSNKTNLSLRASGSARFDLNAGPAQRFKFYLVLGSLSGIRAGLQFDQYRLPLYWDAYTNATLAYPNGSLYTRSFGVLDSKGGAACTFSLAPWLPPAVLGMKFTHSYLVLNPKAGTIDFVGDFVQHDVVK